MRHCVKGMSPVLLTCRLHIDLAWPVDAGPSAHLFKFPEPVQ